MKIALALPSCPWIPERKASAEKLRAALEIPASPTDLDEARGGLIMAWHPLAKLGHELVVRAFTDKAPNNVWSGQVFDWLASIDADWCVQLQEDALIPDNFWAILVAMLEACERDRNSTQYGPPGPEILGLMVAHPLTRALSREGHRWCTTADALVGVGWAMRSDAMREFFEWRATCLVDGWRTPVPPQNLPGLTEDTMIGLFAMATGRRIWHPLPTIVDHDLSMTSVWGNDDHANRSSVHTWRDEEGAPLDRPETWTIPVEVPHLGRFYDATPSLAYRWIRGFGAEEYQAARRDDGREVKRRLAAQNPHVRPASKATERVLVLTPLRDGRTHAEYNATVWRMLRAEGVELIEIEDAYQWQEDLTRVRSRMWRKGLETDATAFWHLDGDVSAGPMALLGMLRTQRPWIMTPYPRRGRIDFSRVAKEHVGPPESRAYTYGIRLLEGDNPITPDGVVLVKGGPLGCAVIRREAIEGMIRFWGKPRTSLDFWDNVASTWMAQPPDEREALAALLLRAYQLGQNEPDLNYVDLHEGIHPTVAVFQLWLKDGELLSEDYTACERYQAMGGECALYLGPGSPAVHHGDHAYRGFIEAFGLQRLKAAE